jgi:hypothetical protein
MLQSFIVILLPAIFINIDYTIHLDLVLYVAY